MAAITQTITIVDKSNKVVSSAKQLKGVFAEAKYAYQARKAEIKAERKRKEEVELQKAIRACSIAEDEARSQVSATTRPRRHETRRRRTGEQEDARTNRSGSSTPPSPGRNVSLGQFNEQLYGPNQGQPRAAPDILSPYLDPSQTLQRRRTDQEYSVARRSSTPPHPMNRSYSATDIDLDLAYGEFYDSDMAHSDHELQTRSIPNAMAVNNQEKELSGLVLKCKKLLDEADCAGQSVKAIIMHLQSNPEAMAAVALTLAEISNIASKMAPTALTALKGTAPAVLALLASPEFLIAVGVGIGVTVVMLGGYKIIKKIKASTEGQPGQGPMLETPIGARGIDLDQGNELLDVKELDRIENWRRGIADTGPDNETGSVVSGYSNATSVEGEFITPFAAQSMGHLPLPKDRSKKSGSGSKKDKDKESKEKKKKYRKRKDSDSADSEGASSSKSDGSKRRESRELVKVKKPSPLRRMFTVAGTSSSTGWER